MITFEVVKAGDLDLKSTVSNLRTSRDAVEAPAHGPSMIAQTRSRSDHHSVRVAMAELVLTSMSLHDEDVVVGRENGEIRYLAPVIADIVRRIDGDRVALGMGHAVFRAKGEVLEQLRASIGIRVRCAADPGTGDIFLLLPPEERRAVPEPPEHVLHDPFPPPPAPPSGHRKYPDVKELKSSFTGKVTKFPSYKEIAALHRSLQGQPHIPFLYPRNGCWARADEMCRLLVNHFGLDSRVVTKVWISCEKDVCLTVPTNVKPDCKVEWFWHVAPLVEGHRFYYVVDPALFDEPVRRDRWRSKMTRAKSKFEYSHWERYAMWDSDDITITEKKDTLKAELTKFRNHLAAQIFDHGPIPYLNCPIQ